MKISFANNLKEMIETAKANIEKVVANDNQNQSLMKDIEDIKEKSQSCLKKINSDKDERRL